MRQVTQQIIDGKIAAAGAGSALTGAIKLTEQLTPLVDFLAGIASLIGMILAAWWTIMRIRDAYAARKNKDSK